MKKYTCELTKEEILKAIAEEFLKANEEYAKEPSERNLGKHIAMVELLKKVKIYE